MEERCLTGLTLHGLRYTVEVLARLDLLDGRGCISESSLTRSSGKDGLDDDLGILEFRGLLVGDLDDMISELRFYGSYDLTDRRCKCGILEWLDHATLTEEAQIATVDGRTRILGVFACKRSKVIALLGTGKDFVSFSLCCILVRTKVNENMACLYLYVFTLTTTVKADVLDSFGGGKRTEHFAIDHR